MNIVVLAGGLSVERDVSLTTGSLVCAALRRGGHSAVMVDVYMGLEKPPADMQSFFDKWEPTAHTVGQDAPDLAAVRALRGDSGMGGVGAYVTDVCKYADIVYMGLHGDDGENGRMQAYFDVLGIRYTGAGYLGSALAMHKGVAKQLFERENIPTPSGILLRTGDEAPAFTQPCVVKPVCGGSSLGVEIPQTEQAYEQALRRAFVLEDEVLVEQYIPGREFTVGVLGNTVLPPVEIIPNEGFYDYAHKYQEGWTEEVCPAALEPCDTKRLQQLALRAHKALRLTVCSRGEFIMDDNGGLWCLEMNTLPGMTPTSLLPQEAAAVGIDYDELCERIVALSMEKYI